MDVWKNISHSSVVHLREVFTTKEFGDNCKIRINKQMMIGCIDFFNFLAIVFVYDFHAGAETLASKHFSGSSSTGWERLSGSLGSTNSSFNSTGNPSSSSDASKRGKNFKCYFNDYLECPI